MEPKELFTNLESNQTYVVEDAKKKLQQMLNMTKDSWLLNGLFDYYLATNSARTVEILVSVREPHDRYLFDRLGDCLKGQPRLQALTVLGHVLRRQPAWLYKISQHQLFKDLLKLLKTETDILPLLSALLVVVVLLPMIPALIGPYLQDIFDIFSRLAAWNCNPGKLAEEQLVHLQVAMYALFLRLYGMYPCNFIAYLRNHYRQGDNKPVFMHTVKPMLSTVLIHPHLVTASKDNETETTRWKNMGHHDVIVECERFAVDVSDRSREDPCYMGHLTPSFRSRSGTEHSTSGSETSVSLQLHQSLKYTIGSSGTGDGKEFWSPSVFFYQHSSSPPPLPEVSAPTSIPQTPNSQITSSVFPQQEGTSPPEAAIEATPETTPIKDMRVRPPPSINSSVARALTSMNSGVPPKWPSLPSGSSTPSSSQPSSPMRKDASPFKFPNSGSDVSAFEYRRDNSHISQRIIRIIQDRSQVNESPVVDKQRGRTPLLQPTSPLRVISLQETTSVPNSPVPLSDSSAIVMGAREWPLARPKPDRVGSPVAGHGLLTMQDSSSQEDQEVVEIVSQGEHMHQMARSSRPQQCDSVLQEFQASHDEEYDDCEQEHGSPCTSGGLHMPNSHSLQAFATRVRTRLRYYSQCAPDTSKPELFDHDGSDMDKGLIVNTVPNKVRRANSCPEMKKNCGTLPSAESTCKALDESDEFSIENSSTPVPTDVIVKHSSMANGLDRSQFRPQQQTVSTQTLDLWPMPYEHLFLGIFPLMEINTEVKPSPSPSPAPYLHSDYNYKGVRFSPYEMLDKYIEYAAHTGEYQDQSRHLVGSKAVVHHGHSLEQEVRSMREQLGLLHLQLQYERHRREVHAVRNRRLLGESRSNKALEEHNSALRDQLSILQKEIENLHDQLAFRKQESVTHEKELQETINYWQKQYLESQEKNKHLEARVETLQRELSDEEKCRRETLDRCHHVEARLFQLDSEMGEALAQARDSQRIGAELERMRTELLLAGELNLRYQEKLGQLPLIQHRDEEKALFTAAYYEEIKNLSQQLDFQNAIVESQKAHISELESAKIQHDEMCAGQKRMLKEVKEEYHEQLKAVESKYETQRAINKVMEERILELWQRVEVLSQRKPAHHSPDTSSCHEAMGGASSSVGGGGNTTGSVAGTSPHSSPPLSASLASSEGSMRAFLLQHTTLASQDVKEIRNLQIIVNQSETSYMSRHFSSEETTPEGNTRSLNSLNNQSE